MTNTTILRVSRNAPGREAARTALTNAGFGVVEAESWEEAAAAVRRGEADFVVCDAEAAARLAEAPAAGAAALPRDVARTLSHDLRTPLSAMAGWLHLMESGKLDEQALKRAISKLRGNIDDQVRIIERVLGTQKQEGQRT